MLLPEMNTIFEPLRCSVRTKNHPWCSKYLLKILHDTRPSGVGCSVAVCTEPMRMEQSRAEYWQECQLAGVSVHDQAWEEKLKARLRGLMATMDLQRQGQRSCSSYRTGRGRRRWALFYMRLFYCRWECEGFVGNADSPHITSHHYYSPCSTGSDV